MTDIIEDPNGTLEFRSTISPGTRTLLLIGAAIPLIAPYELLLKPRWDSLQSLFIVIAVLISLGAVAVSALLAAAALFGSSERITFDWRRNTIAYACKSALLPLRLCEFPMSSVTSVATSMETWTDGPPCYKLIVSIDGHRNVVAGPFEDRTVVERYRERIERLMRQPKA